MKLIEVKSLVIPDIKVVRFARFSDHRGYFTEPFRRSDFDQNLPFLKEIPLVQMNESFSKKGVIRGLHFQWNPYMGKLVRPVTGHMIDLFLDIRKGSPTFGKAAMHDMPITPGAIEAEWIWVPPGFAHGNVFLDDSLIEYCCSGEYSQGCEAGLSPLAPDIDWSLCDPTLKKTFDAIAPTTPLMTDKDKNGLTLDAWTQDPRSENFIYGKM